MKLFLAMFSTLLMAAGVSAADQKAKALAVAKAACACSEPEPKKTKASAVSLAAKACSGPDCPKEVLAIPAAAECKCRSGGECTCTQCKCVDAKKTENARFILVSSPTCPPCQAMKANVVPELNEVVPVTVVDGGYGATQFPTIIYEVNGKEKWRTTGYTSAQTLLSLRGSE